MAIQILNSQEHPIINDFLLLPGRVYINDLNYSPRFRDSKEGELNRLEFQGKEAAFLGYRNTDPVCRVLARISPELTDEENLPMGILGMYESLDDPDTANELFQHALKWCYKRGARTVIGPMNGDTWHSYRFNSGPFHIPLFLMEPYNPAYYLHQWVSAGFESYHEYYSKYVEDLDGLVEGTERFAEKSESLSYRVRTMNMEYFKDELQLLYSLSAKIFTRNHLYTPIEYQEFEKMYTASRALIDPECVFFALDPGGQPAGFLFGYPDESLAVSAMRGRKHLMAKLRFLMLKGRSRVMNAKSLGVMPGHRGTGLAGMMMHKLYRVAHKRHYTRVNLCLFHESNPSGLLEAGLGKLLRRYILFKIDLRNHPEYQS